jgi:hypothetical protein
MKRTVGFGDACNVFVCHLTAQMHVTRGNVPPAAETARAPIRRDLTENSCTSDLHIRYLNEA